MYEAVALVGSGAFLVLAVWLLVRRRSLSWGGRVEDVPDAPPTAMPTDAPGLTLPYSSIDWTAPPKQAGSRPDSEAPTSE